MSVLKLGQSQGGHNSIILRLFCLVAVVAVVFVVDVFLDVDVVV